MKPNSLFKGKYTKKALFAIVPVILCAIIVCVFVVSLNGRNTQTEKGAGGENPDIMSSERGDEEDMEKLYERINFENAPSTKTPLNEENLNKIDKGIDDLDSRAVEISDDLDLLRNGKEEVDNVNPTENHYVSPNDGELSYAKGVNTTDYLDISKFDTLYITLGNTSNKNYAFYDGSKTYVKGGVVSTNDVGIPAKIEGITEDCHYIRITYLGVDKASFNIIGSYRILSLTKEKSVMLDVVKNSFSSFAKFGVIGDSLSVGYVGSASGDSSRNIYYSWGQYMARRMGNVCLNFGYSGVTTKTWFENPQCYPYFNDEDNRCQAYIIGIGTNDVTSGNLGSISDIDIANHSNNADTFYGNYAKIIQTVKEFAPLSKIFVFTIPHPRSESDKNTAIREICNLSGIKDNVYLVDLDGVYSEYFTDSLITECYQNGHFTPLGYANISVINEFVLGDVMNKNPEDFWNIHQIPFGKNNSLD